jgi:hypothetical protein
MMASIETMAGHIFCYALLLRVLRWEFLITVFGRLLLVKYTLEMIIMDRKFDFATCHKASGFDLGIIDNDINNEKRKTVIFGPPRIFFIYLKDLISRISESQFQFKLFHFPLFVSCIPKFIEFKVNDKA